MCEDQANFETLKAMHSRKGEGWERDWPWDVPWNQIPWSQSEPYIVCVLISSSVSPLLGEIWIWLFFRINMGVPKFRGTNTEKQWHTIYYSAMPIYWPLSMCKSWALGVKGRPDTECYNQPQLPNRPPYKMWHTPTTILFCSWFCGSQDSVRIQRSGSNIWRGQE